MADQIVVVPVNGAADEKRGWMVGLDGLLASGDVVFQDGNGNSVDVPFFGFFNADGTSSALAFESKGYPGMARTLTLAAGGWHQQWASVVKQTGTAASGSLFAKLM